MPSGVKSRKPQGGVWNTADRPDRPNPYGVQWRETIWDDDAGGERRVTRTEYYSSKEKRDARAAEVRRKRSKGELHHNAGRGEIEEYRAFKKAIGSTPWQDVVANHFAYLQTVGLEVCTTTVESAVDDEIARFNKIVGQGRASADTLRHKKRILTLFKEQFGDLMLDKVTGAAVEDWIEDFDHVVSDGTFNAYCKHPRTMFGRHVKAGTIRRNPIDEIDKRDDEPDEVGILTPQECAQLFAFAQASKRFKVGIGRLALEAFLGLRFSSGCRLSKEDINFEDRGVLLPKRKIKTRKRHYVDGFPDQVWAWLAITPEKCWELTPRQYMQLKSDLFTEAGVPHPNNCLRHSFCTYDIAVHRNPGRTAYLLCHRNQDLLWRRYKGNGTAAAGRLYQAITPETAIALSRGTFSPTVELLPERSPHTEQAQQI